MEVIDAFIDRHLERILHLHLSDAKPPDHEGLQVGEGDVDMERVLRAFRGMDITAVPEIMGGHRGGGLSFRRALEELRGIEASID
jgi:sugar phosphate isomerase/epimerase